MAVITEILETPALIQKTRSGVFHAKSGAFPKGAVVKNNNIIDNYYVFIP